MGAVVLKTQVAKAGEVVCYFFDVCIAGQNVQCFMERQRMHPVSVRLSLDGGEAMKERV